jgi:hypothetical protein
MSKKLILIINLIHIYSGRGGGIKLNGSVSFSKENEQKINPINFENFLQIHLDFAYTLIYT